MDKASIGGVILAIVGIVAGLLIEGGNLGQILQPTAALIVFGGTMGAVLLQFPMTTVRPTPSSSARLNGSARGKGKPNPRHWWTPPLCCNEVIFRLSAQRDFSTGQARPLHGFSTLNSQLRVFCGDGLAK